MQPGENIYVAVIDDDESLRHSLARLFRAAGLQSITYSSAEAFLQDRKHPQFDCLVLDVHLGGMSGLDLHREMLRTSRSPVPVIYVTGHDDPEPRRQAQALGCVAYFCKMDSGLLIDAIHRVVESQSAESKPFHSKS